MYLYLSPVSVSVFVSAYVSVPVLATATTIVPATATTIVPTTAKNAVGVAMCACFTCSQQMSMSLWCNCC